MIIKKNPKSYHKECIGKDWFKPSISYKEDDSSVRYGISLTKDKVRAREILKNGFQNIPRKISIISARGINKDSFFYYYTEKGHKTPVFIGGMHARSTFDLNKINSILAQIRKVQENIDELTKMMKENDEVKNDY